MHLAGRINQRSIEGEVACVSFAWEPDIRLRDRTLPKSAPTLPPTIHPRPRSRGPCLELGTSGSASAGWNDRPSRTIASRNLTTWRRGQCRSHALPVRLPGCRSTPRLPRAASAQLWSVRTAEFQRRGKLPRFDQPQQSGSGHARRFEHVGDSEKLLLHSCWSRHSTLPFSLGGQTHPGVGYPSRLAFNLRLCSVCGCALFAIISVSAAAVNSVRFV